MKEKTEHFVNYTQFGFRSGRGTLFNIFLKFVFHELQSLDESFIIKNDPFIDIRYADDSTLLSTIFEKLALSTAELETSCLKWGMKINVGKCKSISNDIRDIMIEGSPVGKVYVPWKCDPRI